MDELDPRLREQLDALRTVPPRDPRRAAKGRSHFLRMAEALKPENSPSQAVSSGWFWRLKEWIQPKTNSHARKEGLKMVNILIAALMAVSVLFGGGAAAAYASQDAMPGEILYPVKQVVEQAELAVTFDPQEEAELHLEFAQERAAEVQALVAEGRSDLIPEVVQNMQEHLAAAEQMMAQMQEQNRLQMAARMAVMTDMAAQTLQQAMTHADAHAQQALQMALERTKEIEARAMEQYAQARQQGESLKGQAQQMQQEVQQQVQEQVQAQMQNAQAQIFTLMGTIEAIEDTTWVVDGQQVTITNDTRINGDVAVGAQVSIHGYIDPSGAAVAVQVKVMPKGEGEMSAKMVTFQGVVEAQVEGAWTISGQTVALTDETKIQGQIVVGDQVMVVAMEGENGLEARMITLIQRGQQHGQGQGSGMGNGQGQGQGIPMPTVNPDELPTMMPTAMPTMPWGDWGGHDGGGSGGGHDGGNH